METKLGNRDASAWEKGDLAYELGDQLDMGIIKAAKAGIRPGSDGYAAFITAFARRVRSKQVSPKKLAQQETEEGQNSCAVILTPDFLRAAS